MKTLITRDSALWWLMMLASLLTYLSGHFNLIQQAFPGLAPVWESRIELASATAGVFAAYMRMSPLRLSPSSELSGQLADPAQSLTLTGRSKKPDENEIGV